MHADASITVGHFNSGGVPIQVDIAATPLSGNHPAVLLLPGEDGETPLFPWGYTSICTYFSAAGYNCFVVHFLQKTSPVSNVTDFTQWIQVVNDATTWAGSQQNVDPARIAVMGISLGTTVGVSSASRDFRIKALAAWSGAEATWYENAVKNTIVHMPPTIIIHGALDTLCTMANVTAFQALLNGLQVPNVLVNYPNDGHAFKMASQQQALAQTLTYFQTYLGK